MRSPPEGFIALPEMAHGTFDALARPFYVKDDDGALVSGFYVEPKHTNPMGLCHGGMLATFCDVHLAIASIYQSRLDVPMAPTISLNLDYLAPIALGAWVEGRVQVLRAGRRILFAQEVLWVEGRPAVRASGTFSVAAGAGPSSWREALRVLLTGEASG